MNQVLSLARKELRGYFRSPVALIFIGTFLLVTLFVFFWVETFFRRNLADVRPLFRWLPVLLVFLVGALSMRLWSEEQRSGTLEVLLTLPVKLHRLVLGKFLAGWALCGIALALTLGLPITAAMLGDLDWGPVIGGYLGAMLLAGAYLAIGLFLSSTTDNPIVALISTTVACGVLYLIGSESVVSFASNRWVEALTAVGSGSRFESIQRGVIDLRDLLYYATLIVGFLLLNVALLRAKRWSRGQQTRPARVSALLTVGLALANLLALNLLAAPVRAARVDLTARNEYSISPVTKNLLRSLDAPLLIRGYFSGRTHPLLAPLVPRIRDLAQEYAAVGGAGVRVEFLDPRSNPAAEKEANEDFGIKSVPFQFEDPNEAGVVNSYFTLLVKYGDKHETLNFQDLIEVKVTGLRDIEVKLRDLEYDLTRTIKKVVYGFQPLEEVFARSSGPVTLTAYVTPRTLPKPFREIPERLDKVVQDLKKRAGDRFRFETVDPSGEGKDQLRRSLYQKHGIKPLAVSLFSEDSFYLHFLLKVGDKQAALHAAPDMSEADLRSEITAALKRMTPGFLKTLGLMLPPPDQQPPPNPMMPRRPPENTRRYEMLRERLSETYTVRDVDLKEGRVPGDLDALLLIGPENLDEKQRFAVDQYLMRGGAVVVAAGAFVMNPGGMGGLAVKPTSSGLEEMLAGWGVTVQKALVLDPQNEAFPIPVERNVMGMMVRELQLINYPFFVDVRQDGMAEDNLVVRGLPSVTLQWASPLEVKAPEGLKSTTLLRSSKGSWTQTSTGVQPDFEKHGDKGFGVEGETRQRPLGVLLTGTFKSAFADKPSPLFKEEGKPEAAASKKSKADPAGRTIKSSADTARLVVIGSSEFLNDLVLGLSRQTGSERYVNNLQLMQNIADWSVADIDLLSIRSRGSFARTLKPLEPSARSRWTQLNFGLVVVGLGLIVGVSVARRRGIRPMQLVSPKSSDE